MDRENNGNQRVRGRGRASAAKQGGDPRAQATGQPQVAPASGYGRAVVTPFEQGPRAAAPGLVQGQGRATLHRVQVPAAVAGGSRADGNGAGEVLRGVTSEAARGAMRGRRPIIPLEIVKTRPEGLITKKGSTGQEVTLQANFFRVVKKPMWTLYQYRVDFNPDVELLFVRKGMMHGFKSRLNGYLFDGTVLFTTTKLPDEITTWTCKNKNDEPVQIIIKFVTDVSMTNSRSLQVLNLILRKSMEGLKLQLVGRNFFDPAAKIEIRDFRIQLWPGYLTSIRQHENDVLMCAEISHKTMRTETLLDILQRHCAESRDYQESFKKDVLGTVVLTDYNNKTYRVDDVDFNSTPENTFETRDGPISYVQYYLKRYNIQIRDRKQPVLLSKSRERDIRAGQSETIVLIPELCRATGLTDQMRANFRLMAAVAEYTRIGPDVRIQRLQAFNNRLKSNSASQQELSEWQMRLDDHLVELPGRILANEFIVFGGNKKVPTDQNADWTSHFRNTSMFASVALKRWHLIYPPRCMREANEFKRLVIDAAKGMRMSIGEPRVVQLTDDRNHTYVNALEKCCQEDPQLIMCVVPNVNAERYSSIKKKTCVERSVLTQVMVHKTITPKGGNPRSLMSVATKVAIQMNCKLGGMPWNIDLPISGLMTIGFDVCHDTRNRNKSYAAMVATMDIRASTQFFSAVTPHESGEELSKDIPINIEKAIGKFRSLHGQLPGRIVFYRDGVGEGDYHYVLEHEVKMIRERLDRIYSQASAGAPKFTFIIVSKRINARFFYKARNPPPGTVVDDVITQPERYDFFLVSQSVRQGTVAPTSYNVVFDGMNLSADKLQILTYKMTHLYFNWSGTTRVPAVCQYAHKLAFLVGQSLHQNPSNQLENLLYFL